MQLPKSVDNLISAGPTLIGEAVASGNLRVLATLLGPAYRGLIRRRAKGAAWDRIIVESRLMSFYRETMFRRIVPNLKRTGLLSERVRPRYAELGLLAFEHERAAPDLTAADLLEE